MLHINFINMDFINIRIELNQEIFGIFYHDDRCRYVACDVALTCYIPHFGLKFNKLRGQTRYFKLNGI